MAKSLKKRLNLALQGGGAHGAYAWGVLDALLADGRIEFDGICATSAGSLNAAALAHGLSCGDTDLARSTLEKLWRKISEMGSGFTPPTLPGFEAAGFTLFENFTNILSPYQFNPMNINPLRHIIDDVIDMPSLRQCDKIKLFITATDVQTGHGRVFRNPELSTDVLLASAALPFLYQAIVIDQRAYWDGGYVGNPSLWPLFYETDTHDLCVVHLNPIERLKTPETAYEINNRINEISFNASLLSELRAIAFVKKLIEEDWLKEKYKKRLKNIHLHAIRADQVFKKQSIASKFQTDWPYLNRLKKKGIAAGKQWLGAHFADLGKRQTIDIHSEFLDKVD